MQYLVIHLRENSRAALQAEWRLFADGQKIASSTAVTDLAELRKVVPEPERTDRKVIVLVPGAHVLLKDVDAPEKQRKHIKKLLPFLIEEHLAEDVALFHLSSAQFGRGNNVLPLAIVLKETVRYWCDSLQTTGFSPHMMLPDMLALPYEGQGITLLISENMIWMRTGAYSGAAFEPEILPGMLSLLLNKTPTARVNCYITGESTEQWLVQLQQHYPEAVFDIHTIRDAHDFLGKNAASHMATEKTTINLLQGVFLPKSGRGAVKRIWRRAGWLMAVWFVLQMALYAGQSTYFSYQAGKFHTQSLNLYSRLFPQDKKIIDAVTQMKQHLAQQAESDSTGFTNILQIMSSRWTPEEIRTIHMQNLTYSDNEHLLSVTLLVNDIETLNRLVQKLDGKGLVTKVLSVVNTENHVKGQLSIRSVE